MTDRPVYITAMGAFLPGEPIANDQIEDYLGMIGGKPSVIRSKILKKNGIQSRYYALDREQKTTHLNSQLAAEAVRAVVRGAEIGLEDIDLLACATSQGDLPLPGFASQVHGELGLPPLEILTTHGVCSSGIQALKAACHQVQLGQKLHAIACASELTSRLFKHTRFERLSEGAAHRRLDFDTEFLRWMLSDGAGAALLQPRPRQWGPSLRIDWIELTSYAGQYPLCMYSGTNQSNGGAGLTWLDYPSFQQAADDGAINLKQDVRLLPEVLKVGVDGLLRLVQSGRIIPDEIDYMLCHYSSHFFKADITKLLELAGCHIPEEKWFTNLYTKGNTGAAAFYIMLEELFNERTLQPGQQIIGVVPESGRFTVAYLKMTVVGPEAVVRISDPSRAAIPEAPPDLGPLRPELMSRATPLQQRLIRELSLVWLDFERRMRNTPLLLRLERGTFTVEDYKMLLRNLRQQVMEGGRWIARAASSITIENFELRSAFIRHAQEEHRDYQMLERDYVAIGGSREEILNAPKNVGSEAFSAYMFHQAGRENPIDLLGAMFIIEGLGNRLAASWAERIRELLGLTQEQVSFLAYHGVNDEHHLAKLEEVLTGSFINEATVPRIVKTAKVVARLYRLQIEEVDNI